MVQSVDHQSVEDSYLEHAHKATTFVYGGRTALHGLPDHELGDEEIPPAVAARLIKDLMLGDARPQMNLASFVSTSNETEVTELMKEAMSINLIDAEEYPSMVEIEQRCVKIIGNLFHAPKESLGVSTVGSSEAIILAVLAAKRLWRDKRKKAGKPYDSPNLVMNSAVQVCWEKAVNYCEVEPRYIYCEEGRYSMDPQAAVDACDENTILVCSILGVTYTGAYEDTKAIDDLLEKKNKAEGLDIHIHVDAASGGFVAPFASPQLVWDFQLPLVCSINASGHKYGLAYAGVGWLIMRSKEFLPDSLVFTVNYLGADQISFTLNFSKSAIQVINQYYNLCRLGKSGYSAVMNNLTVLGDFITKEILAIDDGKRFELICDNTGGKGLPLVCWRLKDGAAHYDEFAIAHVLRESGWVVPAYTMAPHMAKLKLMRIVIRDDFSRDRARAFLRDLKDALKRLDKTPKAVLDHHAKQREEKKAGKDSEHSHSTHNTAQHNLQRHGKTQQIC